ncbi:MAG: hypothetical protein R2853_20185 [Thermomicrobiales bacterium]|nr:hypothetical protein [Thermomicrobiales bacterium]
MAEHEPDLPVDAVLPGDTTWHSPAHTSLMSGRSDASYWLLVDHLMHMGWYRLGQRVGNSREWGFRKGFTLPDQAGDSDTAAPQERWITAAYEQTAMRRLLREVEGRPGGS